MSNSLAGARQGKAPASKAAAMKTTALAALRMTSAGNKNTICLSNYSNYVMILLNFENKKRKRHLSPRSQTISIICHFPDPPCFPLVTSFSDATLSDIYVVVCYVL
jgi:hypothetical protein